MIADERHARTRGVVWVMRLVTFGGLAVLALFPGTGVALQRAAFVAVLVSAFVRVASSERLPLFAAFELGVALVVLGDDLSGSLTIGFDEPTLDAARRYLVLASSSVVLGHQLTAALKPQVIVPGARPQGRRVHVGPPKGRRKKALWVIAVLNLFVLWRFFPDAVASATEGRVGQAASNLPEQTVFDSIFSPLARAASMALPALWVWWFGPNRRGIAALISLPILGLLMVSGTRYYLLVGVAGLLLSFRFGHREIIRAGAVGLVGLLLAGWVITATRSEGLATSFSGQQLASNDIRILGGEGVLNTVSQIVAYTSREGLTNGSSLLSIAVFWVPRPLWPDKPELLGYWFPRAYGLEGFSDAHSVSSGFGGDVLIDFGMVVGGFLLLGLGALIQRVDIALARARLDRGVLGVASGCLYGLAFFAARSLTTGMASAFGVVAVVWLVLRASGARRPPSDRYAGTPLTGEQVGWGQGERVFAAYKGERN